MSETRGGEMGQGLTDPELIRQLIEPPNSGREVTEDEVNRFIGELQILMDAVDKLAARGLVYLQVTAEFAAGPEPNSASNRLGFNYSSQD